MDTATNKKSITLPLMYKSSVILESYSFSLYTHFLILACQLGVVTSRWLYPPFLDPNWLVIIFIAQSTRGGYVNML